MNNNPCFPRLFSPQKVGGRTLRNRIVLSATLTNFGAGHRVTDRWTNFLAERAKGGCGAIVTEVIAVDPAALSHGAIVREIPKVGLFLWSTPRIADDGLAQPLREAGVDLRLVGDCVAPRNLLCAIHEGEAVAIAI